MRRAGSEKAGIVRQILASNNRTAEMKRLGIYPNQFYSWKKLFGGKGGERGGISRAGSSAARSLADEYHTRRDAVLARDPMTRRVPVTTMVVDTPARITAAFDIVDEITAAHGLVTSEMVPASVSVDGAERVGDTRLAHFEF